MTDFSRALLTKSVGHRPNRRHISLAGRPAEALPFGGMPAYESQDDALAVMETIVVTLGGADRAPMMFPMSYRATCVRAPDCLAPLHDDPDALWVWRPRVYTLGGVQFDSFLGSQQELAYRIGVYEAICLAEDRNALVWETMLRLLREEQSKRGGMPRKNARKRLARALGAEWDRVVSEPMTFPSVEASRKADRILLEFLSPQQRIDLVGVGGFYVRGRINHLYEVRPGEGAAIVDPVTRERTVSLCLHPEGFIPHGDVALATKLGIEAGEDTEAELLEAANPTVLPAARPSSEYDRLAYRLTRRYALDR